MKKPLHLLTAILLTICLMSAMSVLQAQDTTVCSGGSATLTVTGGTAYQWSNSETTASIVVTPAATTQYKVTVTETDTTIVDSMTVTVAQNPTVEAGDNSTIYQGNAVTLTATTSGGISYLWSTTDTTAQIIVEPASTIIYTVTVENTAGCTASDEVTITVNDNIPATQRYYSICTGQSATLSAPKDAKSYQWSTSDTTASVVVSPSTSKTFWVRFTSITGNIAVDSLWVQVRNNPSVDAGRDTVSPEPDYR